MIVCLKGLLNQTSDTHQDEYVLMRTPYARLCTNRTIGKNNNGKVREMGRKGWSSSVDVFSPVLKEKVLRIDIQHSHQNRGHSVPVLTV